MPRRFPGTANGSMTADCDVTGSSPVRGAKKSTCIRRCFLLFSPDNLCMYLYSKYSSIAQSVVRRSPAAGGRVREIDEVQRSEKRSGVCPTFSGHRKRKHDC